jgi:hypothetical protein
VVLILLFVFVFGIGIGLAIGFVIGNVTHLSSVGIGMVLALVSVEVLVVILMFVLALVLTLVFRLVEALSFLGGSRRALGELGEALGVLECLLELTGDSRRFYDTLDTNK